MFDFFFRRPKRTAAPVPPVMPAPANQPTGAELRQRTLDQAAALPDDEVATVDFILGCSVPEARLLAAQKIQERALLEKVRKAMRETDRRVVKLMQQRLDALATHDAARLRAEAVLQRAVALCGEAAPRANQVVVLEREWQAVSSPPAETHAAFAAAHAMLERRLQAQSTLQRRVLDAIAALRSAITQQAGDGNSTDLAIVCEALDAVAADADATIAGARCDTELPSLPKQHLPELSRLREALQRLRDKATDLRDAVEAREKALDEWEHSPRSEAPPVDAPTPDMLRRAWRELAPVADGVRMQALQERFDALLGKLAPAPTAGPAPDATPATGATPAGGPAPEASADSDDLAPREAERQRLSAVAALETLQAALEEGALQRAMEQDRILRGLDARAVRLPADRQGALSAARAELARLQGWARWGGTVSREELLAAVEVLPQQSLPISELARKVGSMRERWRALDVSAGPAPRALWLRFDAACTTAHAPVAMHFAALAEERAANALKGQALLDEVDAFGKHVLAEGGKDTVDWHAVAAFCQRMRQAWQRLGPLERKEQKRLDAALSQALAPLQAPLEARQRHAIGEREELIDAVGQLSPQARDTPERLQALQSRWQHQAKSFPLMRQQEQMSWQRFRAACDAVYAERKSAGAAADAERSAALQVRQAVCASLESVACEATLTESQRAAALREARRAWAAAGAAPRSAQAGVQARFDAAVATIMAQDAASRRSAGHARGEAMLAKLRLCLEIEHEVVAGVAGRSPADRIADWDRLPPLPAVQEAVLRARFDAACSAQASGNDAHAGLLQENRAARDAELLKLEVSCGIESPPDRMRERLALQVAGLQASLRTGTGGQALADTEARLLHLLAMPACADATATERMERIMRVICGG